MDSQAPVYLDLAQWPRRAAFDFFRGFDLPCFNICVRLDVGPMRAAVRELGCGSLTLATHYTAIRLANEVEPFRYRAEGDAVRVHPVVHGSTTVLREDESFGFATLLHQPNFLAFAQHAQQAIAQARDVRSAFVPAEYGTGTVHLTTLPWLHFTSYSNARQWGEYDTIPKIAFGKIQQEGDAWWMPLSVEVHHAMMDGLHVGRFVQAFEAALRQPKAWLLGAETLP